MSDKPLFFLDVDGVINCFSRPFQVDCLPEFDATADSSYGACDYPINMPVGTVERIARILEVYDPVWCTTWKGSAHREFWKILEIGEKEWDFIAFHRWKLPYLVEYASGRRWVWVDDYADDERRDLIIRSAQYEKALKEYDDPDHSLVVIPRSDTGMTDEHVEEILSFA